MPLLLPAFVAWRGDCGKPRGDPEKERRAPAAHAKHSLAPHAGASPLAVQLTTQPSASNTSGASLALAQCANARDQLQVCSTGRQRHASTRQRPSEATHLRWSLRLAQSCACSHAGARRRHVASLQCHVQVSPLAAE